MDIAVQQAAQIAALTERVAAQQASISTLRSDFKEHEAYMRQQVGEIGKAINTLTDELSARKEFGRGVKFGITVFWVLLGGTVTTFINKFFFN